MKKTIAFLAAVLVSAPLWAATSSAPASPPLWVLKRGTTTIGTGYTDDVACWAAGAARAETDQQSGNYTCLRESSRRITYTTGPACPAQPAQETRSTQCTAPEVGTWQQTRSYTSTAAPTCWQAGPWLPAAAPAGACTSPPPPVGAYGPDNTQQETPPAGARVIYFAPTGSNANAGTLAAPKRDIGGAFPGDQPAGTYFLFQRGGSYAGAVWLDSAAATEAQPLVFAAYGTGAAPELTGGFIIGGTYGNTVVDGGYTLRNIKIDGKGAVDACITVTSATRATLFEQIEVTGCRLGFNNQNMPTGPGNQGLVVRKSWLHHNTGMGYLGDGFGLVIEDNLVQRNNPGANWGDHGIYIAGHGTGGIVRRNVFDRNSVSADGVCRGGNLTVHGQWDGMLIEGNTIVQDSAEGSCYGMSITPGYDSAEFFRNFVVQDNVVVNVGGCAYCAGAAVGPVFRRNKVVMTTGGWVTGFLARTNVGTPGAGGDDIDSGMTVEDNLLCFHQQNPVPGPQVAVNLGSTPGSSQARNTVLVGAAAQADARCALP